MNDFLIIHAEFSATEFTIEPANEKGAKELQRRMTKKSRSDLKNPRHL